VKILGSMNRLLRLRDDESVDAMTSASLLIGATLCMAAYAIAAGFFQGGWSVVLALVKIPLIIFGSMLLCLPSLYIFTALGGSDVSPREFVAGVAGFCGTVGLILLALMPITWLFAVSTLSLTFVVWLHVFIWFTALAFGRRAIVRTFGPTRGAVGLWLVLLFLVSLQMTTYLRPVLWHVSGAPLVELEKESFFTHLSDVIDFRPAPPVPLPHRVVERR
jgi:hypothetical protein